MAPAPACPLTPGSGAWSRRGRLIIAEDAELTWITTPASEQKREPQVRTTEITAWYTDKIRPFLGPERYNTLPGAVLAIDMNNGERVIVAKTIELRELKKNELKEPTNGTKTTQAEFRKLMEEQMKQMGGRGMVIRN